MVDIRGGRESDHTGTFTQYLKVIDIISDHILLFRKPLDAPTREGNWEMESSLCSRKNK